MSETTIIHYRDADWERGDIYIGRAVPRRGIKASPFANPFKIGDRHPAFGYTMAREDVLAVYCDWVRTSKDPRAVWQRANVHVLRGHRGVCWCAPPGGLTIRDRPFVCHGQDLAEMADAPTEEA